MKNLQTFRAMLVRFAGLFRRKQHEADMNEELRAHVDALTERNLAAGMSADEARFAALRAFGGVAQIAERARDERRSVWGEQLWQDLRYAVRQLRKTPGFTAVAVLSLALGIGANTALFSLVDAVLLKKLPVGNPGELVVLTHHGRLRANHPKWIMGQGEAGFDPVTGVHAGNSFSPAIFRSLDGNPAPLIDVFAFGPMKQINAIVDGEAEMIPLVQVVTGTYFSGLGVGAAAGRRLTAEDDQSAAAPVAVMSHRYWRTRFNQDHGVIGRTVWLNGVAVTIVGVAPAGFAGTLQVGEAPAFFVPLSLAAQLSPTKDRRYAADSPSYWWLRVMGRLPVGTAPHEMCRQLEPIFQQAILAGFPEMAGQAEFPRLGAYRSAQGLLENRRQFQQSLLILTGIVALVLIVACVNLASLLLARATVRRREIAVRLALGASRGRLLRQLLTESLLLAVLGGAMGALFAVWGRDLLLGFGPETALELELALDGKVLAFTLAIAVATGLTFGLLPALRATRVDLTAEFQGGARTADGGRRFPLGKLLTAAQVGLSLVLLVGAALLARTLQNLQRVDPGFDRSQLLLFTANAGLADRAAAGRLYRRINERIATVPGVQASTFSAVPLLSGKFEDHGGSLPGERTIPGLKHNDLGGAINGVGPGFFSTYRIRVIAGRALSDADAAQPKQVAVINESLARKYFPGEDPIGQSTNYGEIVGVVRDVRDSDLKRALGPTVYVDFRRVAWMAGAGHFAVRTEGDARGIAVAVRQAVQAVDPKLPLFDVRTQDEQVWRLMREELLVARLAGGFGVLALGLVCMGLYGLMSYAVLRRTKEIGVRVALGAAPERVLRMIVRESLVVVAGGVAMGMAVAAAAARLMAHLLFGISSTDAVAYGGATALLMVVALLAALLPARRAARIDPMVALRAE